jgi:two-component system sensor histidine kinase TctE
MKKEKNTSSIRRQLLSWILIPIIGLCVVTAIISYVIAIQIATEAYDAALLEGARELANRLHINNGQIVLDLPPSALALFKEDKIDKFYYVVLDDRAKLIGGDLEILPTVVRLYGLRVKGNSRFFNRKIDKTSLRIVCMPANIPEQPYRKATVYVAETTLKRQALINEILGAVIFPQLCFISSAALAVWFGVARGLAPLEPVRRAIASRTQWDLRPVKQLKTPVEIKPLVSAIDDLLIRLNEDIESQHRFVANAAHQLRTPLAGLKTHLELGLRATNKDELATVLKQVNRSVDNMTRLVNQLLSLAKLEPASAWLVRQAEIDLNPVIKEATSDLVPWAVDKDIDLGFEGCEEPAIISGDKSSIRELVTNLVDNAIRYTQPGGKVTVKLAINNDENKQKENVVDLSVEDNGPGIPESEKEKVFERFYRVLGNNVPGSGLGLAIVKEIVQVHDAKIWIDSGENGKGTVANVRFPVGISK